MYGPTRTTAMDGPRLAVLHAPPMEFRRGLDLGSPDDRRDALTQIAALARQGGGFLVYGLDEWDFQRHRTIAHAVRPLTDPSIPRRLERFLTQALASALRVQVWPLPLDGGFVLVLEVEGSRPVGRPAE